MENRREGGEKYTYDLDDNRLSRQRRNLLSVTEYIYDENGSLIREKEGEKETGYRYDLLNRQTHVLLPDGREQENLYDGEGLRAGLIENGKSITFLFYNGEILAEHNGDSMSIRRHLRGFGLSNVEDISTGTSHAYHQDEQGSTAYVTGITGEAENFYSYDGFGNVLEKKEDITNRILYTGQQYDQETGQYYLRARYYNPVIGRFTQEDTYRGDGLNLYAYCGNNPVMYYDPSGHMQLGYDDDYNAAGNTRAAGINNNSNVNGSGKGIEGGTGTYTAPQGGGGITSSITVNGKTVTFGHGGRHLNGTGLDINVVNEAIANKVSTIKLGVGDFFKGQIVVDRITIEFTSYGVSEGIINVGTYYTIP